MYVGVIFKWWTGIITGEREREETRRIECMRDLPK
jgi:hypothetical protein